MDRLQEAILSIEKALDQGRVFQAHNIASEMLIDFPGSNRLIQLKVISLNRLGQPDIALRHILESVRRGQKDGESMGLLGRTYKSLFLSTGKMEYLLEASEAYHTGYRNSKAYYPAINAAELYLMMGDRDTACQLAEEIITLIKSPQDYWSMATMGEAWLILGNTKKATSYFQRSVEENPKQFGKFRSTYVQLELLNNTVGIPEDILTLFPRPQIAVFSGHMIDDPQRKNKRFPHEIVEKVKRALQEKIEELNIDIGFASLASGGDILFVEILQSLDAEVKGYMPFRKEDFIDVSVSNAGLGWIKRFEDCYDCSPKYLTHEAYLNTPDLFRHLGKVMMGECLLFAEQFNSRPWFLTVLAPEQISKPGGTRDLVNMWPYQETHFNIDPTKYIASKISVSEKRTEIEKKSQGKVRRAITSILFADIVGFSKLLNEDTIEIILYLFEEIRKFIEPYINDIQVINTWGDAIIICHSDEDSIMEIALKIQSLFNPGSPGPITLPDGIQVRIALHNGPVFFAPDPLTGEANVYGPSINRTARMEPVTIPGSIYISDQFAAALKLDTLHKYEYTHVGIIELPKGFGKQEVYRVTKKHQGKNIT